MTLRTLNYGNYGIFLIMGHAGFCPSTVVYNYRAPTFKALRVICSFRSVKKTDSGQVDDSLSSTACAQVRKVDNLRKGLEKRIVFWGSFITYL